MIMVRDKVTISVVPAHTNVEMSCISIVCFIGRIKKEGMPFRFIQLTEGIARHPMRLKSAAKNTPKGCAC